MGFVLKRHFAIHTIIPCFTYDQLYSCCAKVTQNTKVINSPLLIQGSHFSGMTKFPDFSLTFPVSFFHFPVFF